MELLSEIGSILSLNSTKLGTAHETWPVFLSHLPDSTSLGDRAVALIKNAGLPDLGGGDDNPGADIERPMLQLIVRGLPLHQYSTSYAEADDIAMTASRILHGYAGLLSLAQGGGMEVMRDVGFASSGLWSTGGTGTMTFSSGVVRMQGLTSIFQVPTVYLGHVYRTTFTVSSRSTGTVQVSIGASIGTPRSSTGTFTEDLTLNVNTAAGLFMLSSAGDLDVDNLSILGPSRYVGIWNENGPAFIGFDQYKRPLFSANFRVQRSKS